MSTPTESWYNPPETREHEECPFCGDYYPSGELHICEDTQEPYD